MSWPATKSVARHAWLIARCSRDVWPRALHQSRPLGGKKGAGAADGSGGSNGPDEADVGAGADRAATAGTKQKEDAPAAPEAGPMETGGGGKENAVSGETAALASTTPEQDEARLTRHGARPGESDGHPRETVIAGAAPHETDARKIIESGLGSVAAGSEDTAPDSQAVDEGRVEVTSDGGHSDSGVASVQSTEPADDAAGAEATTPESGSRESASPEKEDLPEPSSSGATEEEPEEEEPNKVELKTDPIFREYTYHMQSADTRNWLVNEMVRRAMSAALRAGGTISKGERRHRTLERIWTVNRGPFAHGRHKQQFWMKVRRVEFSWRQDARDTVGEPKLRHAGFRIPEKLPGIIATKVIEKSPGCLSVPDLYHTIQRKRHGISHVRVDRIQSAGNWVKPDPEQSQATRVRMDVVHPDEER